MGRMNRDWDFIIFMRKHYPQVADEQFESTMLKAVDNEEKDDEMRVDLHLHIELSSLLPTCRSSPQWHTTYIMTYMTQIHLSNIRL